MNKKSVISVKEARKILGKRSAGLKDADIQEIIDSLDSVAVVVLKKVPESTKGY